jgi:hypothetical protein
VSEALLARLLRRAAGNGCTLAGALPNSFGIRTVLAAHFFHINTFSGLTETNFVALPFSEDMLDFKDIER